jgi:hypothetical protein
MNIKEKYQEIEECGGQKLYCEIEQYTAPNISAF